MPCILDDSGILLSMISFPNTMNIAENIKEFKFPFDEYRASVYKNFHQSVSLKDKNEFFENFYLPKTYSLFGQYDYAMISLIDDFEFGLRSFRPFDPVFKECKLSQQRFDYQVVFGATPKISEKSNIIDLAQRTFLNSKYPLFAITQLKLNSALVILKSATFMRCLIKSIQKNYQLFINKRKSSFRIIILESFGWPEVILLSFSNSYNEIASFISSVRRIDNKQLKELLSIDPTDKEDLEEYLIDVPGIDNKKFKNDNTLLIAKTFTTFGFDSAIINELDTGKIDLFNNIDNSDYILPKITYQVAPGKAKEASSFFIKKSENYNSSVGEIKYLCSMGESDIVFPHHTKFIATNEFIKEYCSIVYDKELPTIVSNVVTCVYLKPDYKIESSDSGYINLNYPIVSSKDISKVNEKLISLNIAKGITSRVLNMFTNYNCGVSDDISFLSFLDLHPFLVDLCKNILEWKKPNRTETTSIVRFEEYLLKASQMFESAWENRKYSNLGLTHTTDFNLDFKGGIQQVITAYNAAFKTLSKLFGNDNAFLFVTGFPGVRTNRYAMKLDILHIFEPSYFAITYAHEASKDYFLRDDIDKKIARLADSSNSSKKIIKDCLNKIACSRTENIFKEFITPRLFQYLFRDLYSFYYVFVGDLELYLFWNLNYIYTSPESNSPARLINFIVRILSLLYVIDETKDKTKFYSFCLDENLNQSLDINEITSAIKSFIGSLFKQKDIIEWHLAVRKEIEETILKVYSAQSLYSKDFNFLLEEIRDKTYKTRESFVKGQVLAFNNKEYQNVPSYIFVQELFYSYLILMRENFSETNIHLCRDSIKGHPLIDNSCSLCLFDSRGGLFTIDPTIRRKIFQFRSVLIMSLVGMACKEKRAYII